MGNTEWLIIIRVVELIGANGYVPRLGGMLARPYETPRLITREVLPSVTKHRVCRKGGIPH